MSLDMRSKISSVHSDCQQLPVLGAVSDALVVREVEHASAAGAGEVAELWLKIGCSDVRGLREQADGAWQRAPDGDGDDAELSGEARAS